MSAGEMVLVRLRGQPGGDELAELAREPDEEEAALVGGAVRDLLLGREPKELDVVVSEDAGRFARALADALEHPGSESPVLTLHDRFGTAVVQWPAGRIDVARRRAESYPVPGALPQVRPGSPTEDLERRDFTVNALAVPLAGPREGELLQTEHGSEDLHGGLLRVLHDRSFIEDPTRLMRLGRYRARLGFEVEPHTAQLAAEALVGGALQTVSGARLGAELRLALQEPDPLGALHSLAERGVLSALGLDGEVEGELARRALSLLPEDGSPPELMLALLVLAATGAAGAAEGAAAARGDPHESLRELLDRLEFTGGERDRALRAALGAQALAERMAHAQRRSQLRDALAEQPPEAVALAGAIGATGAATAEQARLWFDELRHVSLAITGDDLLAAGLAPGPQIGMRLKAALACKLDGELPEDGAGAELKVALEAAP